MLFSRTFRQLLAVIGALPVCFLFALPIAQAASVTVCATSCDYPTITDAIAGAGFSPGDSIFVGADYASTTETFPLNVPIGVTLDCQNSGAIIGTDSTSTPEDVNSQNNSTIQNCIFNNVIQQNPNVDSATLSHNTFLNNSQVTANGSSNLTVLDNTIRQELIFDSVTTATIDGNSIIEDPDYLHGALVGITNSTSVSITNNRIETLETSSTLGYGLLNIGPNDQGIFMDGNVVNAPNLIFSNGGDMVHIFDSQNVTATHNQIFIQGATPNNNYFNGIRVEAPTMSTDVVISHNTIKIANDSRRYDGITLDDWSNPLAVTSTYNLIYRVTTSSTAQGSGFASFSAGSPSNLSVFSEYNGFDHLNGNDDPTYFPAGAHSLLDRDPIFETGDATSTNDFTLAPFSAYLDVNGTQDIGAVSGVRRSTIQVNRTGTIDYSAVDAIQAADITDSLRTGDTINIANGTYDPFTVTSTADVTSSIQIIGSGAGTIIDAAGGPRNGITLDGIVAPTIRDLVVKNANTSTSQYQITKAIWSFAGNTYDQSTFVGAPPDSSFFVNSLGGGGGCDVNSISNDGTDISEAVDAGTDDWNVALVNLFGAANVTVYTPNRLLASSSDLKTYFENNCTGPSSVTVDAFVPSIFTANGNGSYSFNASVATTASITLKPGETNPPTIARVVSSFAGIKLIGTGDPFLADPDDLESTLDADDGIIQNVTSTNNGYGVWFAGDSHENNVIDSDLRGNLFYDVHTDATHSNNLRDTLFAPDLNGMDGAGVVNVWYTARALVRDVLNAPVGDATVTLTNSHGATSTLITDNTGFTPFSPDLVGFVMTSSSVSNTNEGYNPYTFSVTTSSLSTFATTTLLVQPFQTVTIASSHILVNTPPSAPSGFTTGIITASSIALHWNDTSGGAAEETGFQLQIGTHDPANGAITYATTTLAADSTSTLVGGLLPNVHYTFLLRAANGSGFSTYQGPLEVYTATVDPSVPILGAPTQTTVSITLGLDTNASGTLYAILNRDVSTYLDASGTVSLVPVFQTTSSWNGLVAQGLTCASVYNFVVQAKNGAGVVTGISPPGTVTTAACGRSSGGGGGGGGGGGLSAGSGASSGVATSVSVSSDDATARLTVMSSLGRAIHGLVKLPNDGNPNTQEDSAVYYLGADGRRHAFSNDKVYFSWYCDFSKVAIISSVDLAKIPLGKNITYRPGLRLVKFPSVHTVYIVQTEAVLRPITDEATAVALFGRDWSQQVADISEAFYGDYTIDSPVEATNAAELALLNVSPTYPSGNLNIVGYQDPGLVSGSSVCPMNKAIMTSAVWPFKDIPQTFSFTEYLDTNSSASVSIRYLQEMLASLGSSIYPEAKVTGNYGPATQAAVKRYQLKSGIPPSGSVDAATRGKLNEVLNASRTL